MHEISIVENLLNIVEESCFENNIKNVSKVIVNIGRFTCIDKDAIEFAFNSLSKDTICEGAILECNIINGKAYCKNCEKEFEIDFYHKNCPICKQSSSNIIAGYEIILQEIEGEDS